MKGLTLNEVPQIVTLLVFIGLLVGAGALALVKFGETTTGTATVTNETIDFAAQGTNYSFNKPGVSKSNSVTGVANDTIIIGTGNFSWNRNQMTLTSGTIKPGEYKVTYSYESATNTYQAINNATTSIGNASEQLPTIGTIIGVAIIIAVVVGMLYLGSKVSGATR